MSHLEIRLLGPIQVQLDGQSIPHLAGTSQALLAYLATHAGTPCQRTSLAGLLWSDYDESSALTNLRQALRRLRNAIGDRYASPPFLQTTRTTIALDRESDYALDVDAFSEALEAVRAHTHLSVETCATCAERLAEAVGLYQGEFLDGFSLGSALFEEWMVVERERLHGEMLEALGHLAAYREAQGAHEEAARYARRTLALDPWREEAHRALIRALALGGQRSAALAQYEECRGVLREDLGVEPEEETKQLYERIRDGQDLTGCRWESGGKPVRSAGSSNLPAQLTPFVGREREMSEIAQRLADPDCRLLTLVGPGGSGKTRLALESAARQANGFRHGVFFVPLAPLRSVGSVVPTIAQSLGLVFHGEREPKGQLLDTLRGRSLLLLLDNAEHLLQEHSVNIASITTDILRAAPEVKALVTSRVVLGVQGEQRFPVDGMDVPPHSYLGFGKEVSPDHGQRRGGQGGYSAVKLFLQTARQVQPGFELTDEVKAGVVRVCHLVEGMPLGILLAASCVGLFTPDEIADEIARNLDFLESDLRDAPERQRSLRATFDHSWHLLSDQEREAFTALSVFRGGFARGAAQQVSGASSRGLMALASKSLLHRVPGDRYEVHELLRQYAAEKLATLPERERTVRDRHAAHYASALEDWAADLKGRRQRATLEEIASEFDNVQAAWEWAVAQGQLEWLSQAMEGLGRFCQWRARFEEGESAFRTAANEIAALGKASAEAASTYLPVQAQALAWQSYFSTGGTAFARELLHQSLGLLDSPALAGEDTRKERAFVLLMMGELEGWSGSLEKAQQSYIQSLELYQALGDRWGMAQALYGWAGDAQSMANYGEADRLYQRALSIYRSLGDQKGVTEVLLWSAFVADDQGQHEKAERLERESIAICRETGDRLTFALGLWCLSVTLACQGRFRESHFSREESLAIAKDLGWARGMAYTQGGDEELRLGQYQAARDRMQQRLSLARETGSRSLIGTSLMGLGWCALAEGAYGEARGLLEESLALLRAGGDRGEASCVSAYLACTMLRLGRKGQGRQHLRETLKTLLRIRSVRWLQNALPAIALYWADWGETERAVELYALASRFPSVANWRLWEDIAGRHITALAGALPSQAVAVAQERGQDRDLWATVEELLIELDADLSDEAEAPEG